MRLFFSLVLCLASCSSDVEPAPAAGVFVGSLRGGEVLVASIWQPDRVLVYSCGRDGSLDDSTTWLVGTTRDGTVEAEDRSFSVVATREEETVRGTFRGVTDEVLDLRQIQDTSQAGFFASVDGPCRTAAVAFERDGSIVFQGAHFCDELGPFFQVTPVRPPETLGDSLAVRFDDGTGEQELLLERLEGI